MIRRMRGQHLSGKGRDSPKACSDPQISDGLYGISFCAEFFHHPCENRHGCAGRGVKWAGKWAGRQADRRLYRWAGR